MHYNHKPNGFRLICYLSSVGSERGRARCDACIRIRDWAADGLDDDEYLDAPGAWHDGEALGDFMDA